MSRSEKRKLMTTISFRVTDDEAALIDKKAIRHGYSAGQYAKALALSGVGLALPQVRPGPPRDAAMLRQLVGHIGKVGSNLNQLARAANTPEAAVDKERLAQALDDLAIVRVTVAGVLRVRDP